MLAPPTWPPNTHTPTPTPTASTSLSRLSRLNPVGASFNLHHLHTRFDLFDPLTLARSEEHVLQKILPQLRQWCRRNVTLKGVRHPRQELTSESRSQTRPYLADFFDVYD